MRNKTSNQPDAFAWGNMSKAQKYLVVGAILFVLTMMGKSYMHSQSITASEPSCDSAELAELSGKYVTGLENYTGETIDNMAELETAYGFAVAAVEECESD